MHSSYGKSIQSWLRLEHDSGPTLANAEQLAWLIIDSPKAFCSLSFLATKRYYIFTSYVHLNKIKSIIDTI